MTQQFRATFRLNGPDIQDDIIEITDSQFIIGRLDENDLTLKHNKISRQHARLLLGVQGVAIEDLDSSNGTTVGEERLEPNQPWLLKEGDGIGLGPFTLTLDKFVVEEGSETSEAAEVPEKPTPPKQVDAQETTPETTPDVPEQQANAKQEAVQQKKPKSTDQTSVKGDRSEKPAVTSPVQQAGHPPAPPLNGQSPPSANGNGMQPLRGVPTDRSNWLEYLPAMYGESDFFAKFLLIFEAGFAPYDWIVSNFDLYLDAKIAPPEWLQWFGSWVDILVPPDIPEERQHRIAQELGPLFMGRGTRKSLSRHLELVFDAKPIIEEPEDEFATFIVRLPLGKENNTTYNRELAEAIIEAQRPIHTNYRLTIE